MKNILIALDYGPSAMTVAEKGKELADAMGAAVTLLHVITEATYYSSLNYSPIVGFDSYSTMDVIQSGTSDEIRQAAGLFLEKFIEKMNFQNTKKEIGEGNFGDEILRVAKEKNADVIVLGSHGRKGIEKILMGSVANKVLQKSEVPVFIIPIRNS
ncbi:MAG: universal stress protein [Chitinophagaceae bacterium]|nr:universal stress protein [Chitinophagaceae bacterium]